ncbi:MAG: phosphate ABC transporter substrate-binding protein [Treponema sp.]|nr:phosphate ABC transporter substrate-binding protein [Treponema sp.]
MQRKTRGVALCLAAMCLGPVFAGGAKAPSGAGPEVKDAPYTIEIAGSTSVTPLMELLAADYTQVRRNVKININGTGSSDGINAAASGTSEVGMSSRELNPAEKGSALTELVIAIDGIAVIVHQTNPLIDLSIEACRDIYSGKIQDWSELTPEKQGKIAVVSREPGSGTRGAFEELIALKGKLVPGSIEFDGTGAVKAEVSRNADAIGYISLGSVDSSVKPLAIEGVEARSANVINGTYQIARPFILVTRGTSAHEETRRFLEWVLSDAGQAIVRKSWISVKD